VVIKVQVLKDYDATKLLIKLDSHHAVINCLVFYSVKYLH